MLWNGATFAGTPTLWEGASSVGTQSYQLTWNLGVGMGVAPGHGASLFTQSLALISVVQRPPDLWGQADRVRGLSRLPPPYIPESGVVAAILFTFTVNSFLKPARPVPSYVPSLSREPPN